MTGIYFVDMLDVLSDAGCQVAVPPVCNGWEQRARSSGGFPANPLAAFWHHTGSDTSPVNDLNYQINGSPDAPVGNFLLDRSGIWYPVAAGASNCAGRGGPNTFSRGTIPVDGGNTRGWQIEVANNGVGQAWPQVQIDSYFRGSNALNARVGNKPTDVVTHALGSGDGYTSRKIDPATAAAVQGPWKPRSVNSSGTWSLADIRAEANRRAGATPPPTPTPEPTPPQPDLPPIEGDDDMILLCWYNNGLWGTLNGRVTRYALTGAQGTELIKKGAYDAVTFKRLGDYNQASKLTTVEQLTNAVGPNP